MDIVKTISPLLTVKLLALGWSDVLSSKFLTYHSIVDMQYTVNTSNLAFAKAADFLILRFVANLLRVTLYSGDECHF